VSRNRILLLTLVADIVGAVVIIFLLPLEWETSLLAAAIYGPLVYVVSRAYLSRQGSG
jgi:hypothetical protein